MIIDYFFSQPEIGEPSTKVAKASPIIERPTATSLGINQSPDEMLATGSSNQSDKQLTQSDDSWDLDLEGISDTEIDTMILKPAEVERLVLILNLLNVFMKISVFGA